MEEKLQDYLKAILDHYQIAKNGKDINLLDNPTPANLKRLCLEVLERDFLPKDKAIFDKFFEPEPKTLHGFIKSMNADSLLKTPSNFLRTGKTITKIEHADILAILIDFEPRPYFKFKNLDSGNKKEEMPIPILEISQEEKSIAQEIIEHEKKEEFLVAHEIPQILKKRQIVEQPKRPIKNWKIKALSSLAIIFLVGLTGFLVHKFIEPKCMIWKNDHYEKSDCQQSTNREDLKFVQIFPYDKQLFEKFKKLTITDTTTFFNTNGEPIVWYSKQNNNCEYFSSEGIHPISRKKLKPISRTIIYNHILKKKK